VVANFYLDVKSTIDKIAVSLATVLKVGFVELDDTVNVAEKLATAEPMIVYQMIALEENPRDPLYELTFAIGAKTTSDPANYDLATLVSAIKDVLKEDESWDIGDYSGTEDPSAMTGYFYVSSVQVNPQMFDGMAGIRMLDVRAQAVRYP
jgi:hypothetical protein